MLLWKIIDSRANKNSSLSTLMDFKNKLILYKPKKNHLNRFKHTLKLCSNLF